MAKSTVSKTTRGGPAKKATKKPAPSKDGIGIKYSDKSAGQPELVPIFEAIKKMLLPYEKGTIKLRGGTGGQIAMVSDKPIEIAGRKRDELWFAAALIQKGYVGFYFVPIYAQPDLKSIFKPELMKCLKGKSCFHIKKADPIIYDQIKDALKKGYDGYKERGWIG
jgi:hypothetical protein